MFRTAIWTALLALPLAFCTPSPSFAEQMSKPRTEGKALKKEKKKKNEKKRKRKKEAALRGTGATKNHVIALNSASYKNHTGFLNGVARGSFVTLFVSPKVSDEFFVSGANWPERTPGGVSIKLTDGSKPDSLTSKVCTPRIMAHVVSGEQSQINIYIPNHFGNEPYGECPDAGFYHWWITPKKGFGERRYSFIGTGNGFPGIFTENQAGFGVPAGFHVNAKTGVSTRLIECESEPSKCPVSTGGEMNYLVLFGTGAEVFSCKDEADCRDYGAQLLTLNGVRQSIHYYGFAGYLGQEQMNVRLTPQTRAGKNDLRITMFNAPSNGQEELSITLGAPN